MIKIKVENTIQGGYYLIKPADAKNTQSNSSPLDVYDNGALSKGKIIETGETFYNSDRQLDFKKNDLVIYDTAVSPTNPFKEIEVGGICHHLVPCDRVLMSYFE